MTAALTWTRANGERYGIDPDFFRKQDIHIHVPSGAVPKDGPSAGAGDVTALVSLLSGRPIKDRLAMTGEMNPLGYCPADRRREGKSAGAKRAGIKEGAACPRTTSRTSWRICRRTFWANMRSLTGARWTKCSSMRCPRRSRFAPPVVPQPEPKQKRVDRIVQGRSTERQTEGTSETWSSGSRFVKKAGENRRAFFVLQPVPANTSQVLLTWLQHGREKQNQQDAAAELCQRLTEALMRNASCRRFVDSYVIENGRHALQGSRIALPDLLSLLQREGCSL